ERMAVVVSPGDADKFLSLAHGENLEATVVARVTDTGRMVMRLHGRTVVDLSREFLDTNGAPKTTSALVGRPTVPGDRRPEGGFAEAMKALVSDINICSRQGLSEQFDSTIGSGTVLMPFGGRNMLTPPQAMAAKFPVRSGETDSCSVMAYGFDPYLSEADPYAGAYAAVITSVCKLAASGASIDECWLTFQEYFEKLGADERRWGKPLAALLGALDAQLGLRLAAIGGKDSMSGTFENIHVPPTLVSFAIAKELASNVTSPEFKGIGTRVALLPAEKDENGLPRAESVRENIELVTKLLRTHRAFACWAVDKGGVAEGVFKMAIGNGIGFEFDKDFPREALFRRDYGSFIVELPGCHCAGALPGDERLVTIGRTTDGGDIVFGDEKVPLYELFSLYDGRLESVYRHKTHDASPVMPINCIVKKNLEAKPHAANVLPGGRAKPRVLIPVFPGTNCELDSARAMRLAGAEAEIMVVNNLSAKDIDESVRAFSEKLGRSEILFIPGGFSGGDEPEGSAKLITSFMRNAMAADAIGELLDKRGGLILGVCNGFQALIKLGLVPYGRIVTPTAESPTLTYNTIGLHRSRLVHTRCCSNLSPWLMYREVGEVALVPVSHGEGRFVCDEELLSRLIANGQIASQYCDEFGMPSMQTSINPNGSVLAIEGVTSPDGRVFGKMAHSERCGKNLYKNVPGPDESCIFRGAVDYFKL
ncbi:MAG: phosphoribosylformylglycinamidine synthase subunit PurQ, partial [Clostridia bacterium]|nr:phosphoribosylformylglycinamidine synthase subunit PurQ [Clostridia bacterium]